MEFSKEVEIVAQTILNNEPMIDLSILTLENAGWSFHGAALAMIVQGNEHDAQCLSYLSTMCDMVASARKSAYIKESLHV